MWERASAGSIRAAVEGLARQDRPTLVEQWRTLYGSEPPKGISRKLLTRALAYKVQEQAFGGLSPSAERQLRQLARQLDPGTGLPAKPPAVARSLRPGMRLVRSWHGRTHSVQVVEGGFDWRGQRYRSLSMIAREITGTQRNGPAFFGLRTSGEHAITLKRTQRDG